MFVVLMTVDFSGVSPQELESTAESYILIGMIPTMIPLLWISLATRIKRWHDRDKSGAWVLINVIPYLGGLWEFIEVGCLRGTEGPNSFGPDPT